MLAGPCLEETGELLLQTGGFSPRHFLQVLGDREVSPLLFILLPLALNLGLSASGCVALVTCPPPRPIASSVERSLLLLGLSSLAHCSVWFESRPVDQQTSQRLQVAPQVLGPSGVGSFLESLVWVGQMSKTLVNHLFTFMRVME